MEKLLFLSGRMIDNIMLKHLLSNNKLSSSIRLFLIIYVFLFKFNLTYSQTQEEIEYRLKAVFFFNILQFIEWPDTAFKTNESPVVIVVIGRDPFGKILDETVMNEKIGDHPIIIQRVQTLNEIQNCHALFISTSERYNYINILRELKNSSILTVSDIEGFSERGGNIEFFIEDNKIRFAINIDTLNQANLKASSKLLRLARLVN